MNKIYSTTEIDKLIKDYKTKKCPKASLELFRAFEGYLLKYSYYIKYGNIKAKDKDLIALGHLLGFNKNNIALCIFETWEFQDIFNELYLIFLKVL